MNITNPCIETCNKLLRGEISAIETYGQAIEKFDAHPAADQLREIRSGHVESANVLRDHLEKMGGVPDGDSGVWGSFAKLVEGSATILGESAAVSALIEGEEHGISEYMEALRHTGVMAEIKETITGELLPRLEEHVVILESLPS
ncbi:MAG: DUF2383 domain-containing protein [Luteolibacter sp.]